MSESNIIKKEKLPGLSSKEVTRLVSIEVIYACKLNPSDIDTVIKDFLEHKLWKFNLLDLNEKIYVGKIHEDLLEYLVKNIISKEIELEEYLSSKLTNFDMFTEAPLILKIIIYAALFELKHSEAIDSRIIISQYVFIASLYCSDGQTSFVNAALDSIAKSIRNKEVN